MDEYSSMLPVLDDARFAECLGEMAKAFEVITDEIARSLDGFEPAGIPDETELVDRIRCDMGAIPDDFADESIMNYEQFAEDAARFDIPL